MSLKLLKIKLNYVPGYTKLIIDLLSFCKSRIWIFQCLVT